MDVFMKEHAFYLPEGDEPLLYFADNADQAMKLLSKFIEIRVNDKNGRETSPSQ